jgi:hypothetical protein
MELVEEGNNTTCDLYFGGIKNGDENTIEAIAAIAVTIKIGVLRCHKNRIRLIEFKSFPEVCLFAIMSLNLL